ncbi:MAG: 23S rRNA (pseudouridine(1915)-N(3))-methyltransferase RlmH [Lachnospiraceae bacterium]|nr:23S rRNA (pseudouridine(1915)-N(3))-methyltransferase RlmH [Lachnospiraceae bacterium]
MNIKLIVVGNVKENYYRNQIEHLSKQIKKRNNFGMVELKDESIPKNASVMEELKVKESEGARILEHISNADYVYALCIDGNMMTTDELKVHAMKQSKKGNGNLVFIIGGSLGLADKVVSRANFKLSFSRMTFPHQLMRMMLMEQISRF